MKWILVVLAVFLVLGKAKEQGLFAGGVEALSNAPPATVTRSDGSEQPSVVMYATKTCGYCARARKWMTNNGIQWDERDVGESAVASREMRALGGRGVPTFLIGGDEVIKGYNPAALSEQLQ